MGDRDLLITMYKNNPDLQHSIKTGDWRHGLCGCFDNLAVCIIAYFVPCVTWGETASELGKSCCLYGGLFYFVPFLNCYLVAKQRGEIRDIRGIPGSFVGDCLTCGCCSLCALVQERQEVTEIKNDIIRELALRQGQGVIVAPMQGVIAVHAAGYPPQPTGYEVEKTGDLPPPYSPQTLDQKVDRE